MKKILGFLLFTFFAAFTNAQRYAVVDTKYILSKLPAYSDAQTKLDQVAEVWQQDIDEKQVALDKMKRDFEAESIMLPETLRKKREDEIFNKDKELRDLQRKRFGFEGDLFKKRQEIVKPVQDKVYNAIQKLAVEKQYDIIFDKSEGITVIFVDPKLDKSEDILRMIGGDKK
jgi:outer membrane protein